MRSPWRRENFTAAPRRCRPKARALGLACVGLLLTTALGVIACGEDDPRLSAAVDNAEADGAAPDAAAGTAGAASGGAAGTIGSAGASGGDDGGLSGSAGASAGTSGAGGAGAQGGVGTDASTDAPAPVSLVCGDAIRGLTDEECDDGNNVDSDACRNDCRVADFLITPRDPPDGALPLPGRRLGLGRHPIAANNAGFAVAVIEPDASPVKLSAIAFNALGGRIGSPIDFGAGTQTLLFSDPVLAELPGGKYAAAWTDFAGDGDELGVAMRLLDPATGTVGAVVRANVSTDFSQFDPDILWTGSELVVGWVDTSSAAPGTDLKYRRFSSALVPLDATGPLNGESTLAVTQASEADVALARFNGSWAAAWRAAEGGRETIRVRAGSNLWSIGPLLAGSVEDRPALVELDFATLLVVFTEGTDPAGSGVANTPKLRAALLSTSGPSTPAAFSLEPPSLDGGTSGRAQTHPNLTKVQNRIYIAWRSEREPGNRAAEELWLREASFSGGTLTLSDPIVLPRWAEHTRDDQRLPALAALPASGALPEGALGTAWNDYGRVFGGAEGAPDVVVELIPAPVLRIPTALPSEGLGQ